MVSDWVDGVVTTSVREGISMEAAATRRVLRASDDDQKKLIEALQLIEDHKNVLFDDQYLIYLLIEKATAAYQDMKV